MNILMNIKSMLTWSDYEIKPRRALTTRRAAEWGLIAYSICKMRRPTTVGETCADCKNFDIIPGEGKGVCENFKMPKVTFITASTDKRDCLERDLKEVFYSFRTRIIN